MDKDFLSGLEIPLIPNEIERDVPRLRNGGGFLPGRVGRFYRQHPVFGYADVLGMSAKSGFGRSKNLVTFFESFYISACSFNFPGQINPQDIDLWFCQTQLQSHGEQEQCRRKCEIARVAV